MDNQNYASTSKEPKGKTTYLQRLKERCMGPWDSFTDSMYRFRGQIHDFIPGRSNFVCACAIKPHVLRTFKSFEDLIVAEKRRIGWTRADHPTEIQFRNGESSLKPGTSASLFFHEDVKNSIIYIPNEKVDLHFQNWTESCQIDQDRNYSRRLYNGEILHSCATERRAEATIRGFNKIQTTLETFFLWTDGHVHRLYIYGVVTDEEWDNPEANMYSANFVEALSTRPISTILLKMDCSEWGTDLNSKFCTFFLDYVDFTMFSLEAMCLPEQKPFKIPEKLMNCEFLEFHARLVNSEVLRKDFKGWGLILKHPDPKLGFDFFLESVMNWYNGKTSQFRYLSLACDIPEVEWNSLLALGKEIEESTSEVTPERKWNPLEYLGIGVKTSTPDIVKKSTSEIEITRADGEKCRIDREQRFSEPTMAIFHFGNKGKYNIPLPQVTDPALFQPDASK